MPSMPPRSGAWVVIGDGRNSACERLPHCFDRENSISTIYQLIWVITPRQRPHCLAAVTEMLICIGGHYRADVSVAKDRRGIASHAESSRKRQPFAGWNKYSRNKYKGWTSRPFQGNLPVVSDFLLRCCDPAPLRNRSALSCPGYLYASSNRVSGGCAHDARSKPRQG